MLSYYKTLLLVATLCFVAHGNTITDNKDIVTSLIKRKGDGKHQLLAIQAALAAAEAKENLNNLDKTVVKGTPSSAVEDWSLVCQQLCGAALGGAECSNYCKNMPVLPLNVQIENANKLMDNKKQLICPNLCGLQLGDDVCTCKNWIVDAYRPLPVQSIGETNVCAIFCDYKHVTLAGCSSCPNAVHNNVNNLSQNFEAIKPMVLVETTTTPDWNQLCASLCKTGDGGSLCNCDLSPFFV